MNAVIRSALIVSALMFFLTGCGHEQHGAVSSQVDTVQELEQTGMTSAIPAEYFKTAEQQGEVVKIDYESRDYARDESVITKNAYVYLPYGYDENDTDTRYNIVYLMHGGGGHAGEFFEHGSFRELIDNMTEKGDIEPTLIVSPSFYNAGSSDDYDSSVSELRVFYKDFEEHLMPAVEGQFHTYAESTSPDDLKASRHHRAFGGFSLGSVTTWMMFCHSYDYIEYFLPMSGACWYYGGYGDFQTEKNVDLIEQLVNDNDLDERGYFIYQGVGTNDDLKAQSVDMAEEMLSRSNVFTPDHYVFYQKEGGQHDYYSAMEFVYNALPLFFGSEP